MSNDRRAGHLYKVFPEGGGAGTQYNLGISNERGRDGLTQDDREAARLYKLAADQGCADAQCVLGAFYAQGRGGLPQDDREAARLYKLAANQGHAPAQAILKKEGGTFSHPFGGKGPVATCVGIG